MARPQKEGLDYFPLDTDMDLKDDKVQLVEAKYGVIGFAILIKLLMKIYSEGYCYQWGENEGLLFSKRVNVDINTVNDVVNDLVKWGMFDADIFKKYKVLTSNGIQKRFWEVAKRRNNVIINKAFWVHDVDNILVSANINLINVDGGTQRKEKKSKEKKNINNMHGAINTPCQQPAIITLILNDKSEYPITQSQIDEWKDLYPAVDVLQQLKNMKGWLNANPTKRKTRRGILRFINSWLAREQDKGMQAPKSQLTKAPNKGNFDQRKYDNDYFDKLYKEV